MSETYDFVVLGSSTAAQVASARVRAAEWPVAAVDHRPFGGTCALRGCDPKKMLVSGEVAVDAVRRMRSHGVEGDARIAPRYLMAFKRSFTGPVPEPGYRRLRGLARFTDPDAVAADGKGAPPPDGGGTRDRDYFALHRQLRRQRRSIQSFTSPTSPRGRTSRGCA